MEDFPDDLFLSGHDVLSPQQFLSAEAIEVMKRDPVNLVALRGKRAAYWKYFRAYDPVKIPNQEKKVVCITCYNENVKSNSPSCDWELNCGNHGTPPKRHLEHAHAAIYAHIVKNDKSPGKPEEEVLDSYIRYITTAFRPIDEWEDPLFRKFLESFALHYDEQRAFLCFGREKIRSSIISTADKLKEQFCQSIQNVPLAFTSDFWTSKAKHHYVSFTVHYIDEEWKLRSAELDCRESTGSHTASDVCRKLNELLESHNISKLNVSCCITDNEPSNNRAAYSLPYEWIGCFDHLVQCLTEEFTDAPSLKAVMSKARSIVGHFNKSPLDTEKLCNIQKRLYPFKSPVRVVQEVETRWWSTYNMVERLVFLKNAITELIKRKEIKAEFELTENEWEILTAMIEVLVTFKKIQEFMEGEEYVTLSCVPQLVQKMRDTVNNITCYNNSSKEQVNGVIREAGIKMQEYFLLRWGNGTDIYQEHKTPGPKNIHKGIPKLAFFAAALDPRFKNLKPVPAEEHEQIWTEIKSYINRVIVPEADSSQGANISRNSSSSSSSSQDNFQFDSALFDTDSYALPLDDEDINLTELEKEIKKFRAEPQINMFKKERRLVSQEGSSVPVFKEFEVHIDPLPWWKDKQHNYPLLSKLARRILCIPATSASSERLFSAAGNTISAKRTRLNPDIVSANLVVRSLAPEVDRITKKRKYEESCR